jgi:hypothetical protein
LEQLNELYVEIIKPCFKSDGIFPVDTIELIGLLIENPDKKLIKIYVASNLFLGKVQEMLELRNILQEPKENYTFRMTDRK